MPTIPNFTFERVGRRNKVSIEDPQQDMPFTITGSDDDLVIIPYLEAQLSPFTVINSDFLGVITPVLQSYEIEHKGNGIWEGIAHYGKRQPRKTGEVWFQFDAAGGTSHIQTAKEEIAVFDSTGINDTTSFNAAIGVNDQTVDGCDIVVPIFKFTLAYYCPVDLITKDYITALTEIVGTNNEPWTLWDKSEVLYLGCVGQPRGYDDWELLMHFAAAKNRDDLEVGDITNIQKDGHEYLWVRFKDSTSGTTNPMLIKVPNVAIVDRVYDSIDFTQFALPDQWEAVGF